jgi:hypothetical protein
MGGDGGRQLAIASRFGCPVPTSLAMNGFEELDDGLPDR